MEILLVKARFIYCCSAFSEVFHKRDHIILKIPRIPEIFPECQRLAINDTESTSVWYSLEFGEEY